MKQFADKIEKWAKNLSYSTSSTKNFWVELTLLHYPQDFQATVSWLANIPTTGQEVKKDFEELSEMVQKIDAWRIQGVYQEERGQFSALIDRIREVAVNIVFTLRKIPDTVASKPPASEAITVEKPNNSEAPETKTVRMRLDDGPDKHPRKEALTAYKLHYEMELTQSQVAKQMTGELKLDKSIRQWQVSRWIKQVENWCTHTGLPIDSVIDRLTETTVHSAEIDAGG